MKWYKLKHPIRTFKMWRMTRKHVANSKVNLYASRKHRLPLEQCDKGQLEAAVRHNERESKRYHKAYERGQRQNYLALATWHDMCQRPIQELIACLSDGQVVGDIKWKRRRKPTEELMRIRKLD